MGRMRSAAGLAVTVLALTLALAGCSGDDGKAERAHETALHFAIAVERITGEVDGEATAALTALNGVADRKLRPASASAALDRRARAVRAAQKRLESLRPPAAAKSTAGNLQDLVGDLARSLESVATDIRVARRERAGLKNVAFAGVRLVLSGRAGVSTLGQALRVLVDVSVRDA